MAADLGITAESLRTWVRKENESQAVPERRKAGGSPAEELAQLRAENARLLKAEKEWQLEREILRGRPSILRRGDELVNRFQRWALDGTFERMPRAAQAHADAARHNDWLVSVDSTIVRVHQHAAGGPKKKVAVPGSDAPKAA